MKNINNSKFTIHIVSNKKNRQIETLEVVDNRTNEHWDDKKINERGIRKFNDTHDLEETLNWNLNGDSSRYKLKWGMTTNENTYGIVYVFN